MCDGFNTAFKQIIHVTILQRRVITPLQEVISTPTPSIRPPSPIQLDHSSYFSRKLSLTTTCPVYTVVVKNIESTATVAAAIHTPPNDPPPVLDACNNWSTSTRTDCE